MTIALDKCLRVSMLWLEMDWHAMWLVEIYLSRIFCFGCRIVYIANLQLKLLLDWFGMDLNEELEIHAGVWLSSDDVIMSFAAWLWIDYERSGSFYFGIQITSFSLNVMLLNWLALSEFGALWYLISWRELKTAVCKLPSCYLHWVLDEICLSFSSFNLWEMMD